MKHYSLFLHLNNCKYDDLDQVHLLLALSTLVFQLGS